MKTITFSRSLLEKINAMLNEITQGYPAIVTSFSLILNDNDEVDSLITVRKFDDFKFFENYRGDCYLHSIDNIAERKLKELNKQVFLDKIKFMKYIAVIFADFENESFDEDGFFAFFEKQ